MIFTLKTIIAFIVALLILVSVHEYGHYLVARFFNIKVLRFSIGFGKPFWSKKKGDTEWCLAPIPLGGYVKMVDTREGEVAPEDLPYAFDKQHPAKRIAVVVAGPLTNLILAIVFFAAAAMFGVVEMQPMVGTVVPNSVAERAGIQENIRINAIDGKPVKNFTDVGVELLLALDKSQAVVINATDENGVAFEYKIDTQTEKAAIDAMARGKETFGILPYRQLPVLSGVLKDGAAGKAGLTDGDKIIAINDEPMTSAQIITQKIRQSANTPLQVQYERNGQIAIVTLTPDSVQETPDTPAVGKIGTYWAADEAWNNQVQTAFKPNIFQAASIGVKQTGEYSWLTLKFFGKMLVGQASIKHISGPGTIAEMAGKTVERGIQPYIAFLALVSLSLGVLNLMPIPVLDGGHFLYYAIEWVRGKPLSLAVQEFGVRLGIAALSLLMIIAFFNDFMRWFG
ncbi:MAG: RIP metalloprotease RseP [Neisseriaceae bacterium]|nr:RIP metalloprotease RseP [Neisseriaceae bacterium]